MSDYRQSNISLLLLSENSQQRSQVACALENTSLTINITFSNNVADAAKSISCTEVEVVLVDWEQFSQCSYSGMTALSPKFPVIFLLDNEPPPTPQTLPDGGIFDFITTQNLSAECLEQVICDVLVRRQCDDGALNCLVNKRRLAAVQTGWKAQQKIEALTISRNDMQARLSEKSRLVSTMGHEIRTPLNAIIGYAQLMQRGESTIDKYPFYAIEILKAGNYLCHLAEEVISLSKIESGCVKLNLSEMALDELIGECLNLVEHQAGQKGVKLSHNEVASTIVHVDHVKLRQVLLNLLSNGIKYNKFDGKVEIDAGLIEAGRLRVSITDNGPGIVMEDLDRLFEPFNRLGYQNSDIEGTGIGLSITKRLIELMSGTVSVSSDPGVATIFTVELPC